ncbi:MAG: hypothetical protein ACI8QS_001052 [Planctomycetota bacterium]|jgi:hypothetical protein
MQEQTNSWRQCPTRPEGAEVLIAHRINEATCQGRQRKQFHKCYTCVHRNASHAVGTVTLPPVREQMYEKAAPVANAKLAPASTKKAASASSRQAG